MWYHVSSQVKEKLDISNPSAVARRVVWLSQVDYRRDKADYYIRWVMRRRYWWWGRRAFAYLDPRSDSSMIYADGAGAVIMEGVRAMSLWACLATSTRSDAVSM